MSDRCTVDCGRLSCAHMRWNCRCLMCDERWWSTAAGTLFICPNCHMFGPPFGARDRKHIGAHRTFNGVETLPQKRPDTPGKR